MGERKEPTPPPRDQRKPAPPPAPPARADVLARRREAIAGSAVVALCGLAAKVDAPAFPGDEASPEDVQEWIIEIMRRVGTRIATPKDIEFLRYLAGDYETPIDRPKNQTYSKLLDLIDRLEKGAPHARH